MISTNIKIEKMKMKPSVSPMAILMVFKIISVFGIKPYLIKITKKIGQICWLKR